MALLTLAYAALAFQSIESKLEPLLLNQFKLLPVERAKDAYDVQFVREIPIYSGASQGGQAGQGQTSGPPPKPVRVEKDYAIFMLRQKPLKTVEWKKLENRSTTEQGYIGKLDGWHVYAQAPIGDLIWVMKSLPFSGGVTWQEMAIKGIEMQGKDYNGPNCEYFFHNTGDSSIPLLQKALTGNPNNPWGLIHAIGETSGPGSVPALQKLYWSKDQKLAEGASYALISSPRKAEAKKELLDMLRKGKYIQYIATTAKENSWIEALPVIQKLKVAPNHYQELLAVMEAERTLDSKAPYGLTEAYTRIMGNWQGDHSNDIKVFVSHKDKEMAAAYALALRGLVTKGDTAKVSQTGQTILEQLPKEAIAAVQARFKS